MKYKAIIFDPRWSFSKKMPTGRDMEGSMKYKAIIFDMDGTILHSERRQYTADDEAIFVEGFLAFHAKLQKHNLKIAIATNATAVDTQLLTESLRLDALFGNHIYNVSHVRYGKPMPDIYLHAAAKLNVPPETCIVIEDSHHGLRAARDAGMYCIGINTSKQPERLILAHLKIDHYDEIDLEKILADK